jgi:hypothetical protein
MRADELSIPRLGRESPFCTRNDLGDRFLCDRTLSKARPSVTPWGKKIMQRKVFFPVPANGEDCRIDTNLR